jgi:hypothetical protein
MTTDDKPSELIALGMIVEAEHREEVRRRRSEITKRGLDRRYGRTTEPSLAIGVACSVAAKAVGMGRTSYEHGKQVLAAAQQHPDTCGDLVEYMDRMGIYAAWSELRRRTAPSGQRHRVHNRTLHLNSARTLDRGTKALEGIVLGFEQILLTEIEQVSAVQRAEWLHSISSSLRIMRRIYRTLEHQQRQQTAVATAEEGDRTCAE